MNFKEISHLNPMALIWVWAGTPSAPWDSQAVSARWLQLSTLDCHRASPLLGLDTPLEEADFYPVFWCE